MVPLLQQLPHPLMHIHAVYLLKILCGQRFIR